MTVANKIIINADNFGYSTAVNEAIVRSFQCNLITSTSLMANMPGFDDAVRLVQEHPFFSGKVGLQLNLTEGYSLSMTIREKRAVYKELKAQLDRVFAAGIRPSHLDSHHHIHTEWAIAKLTARLGGANGIRKIRLIRNMGLELAGPKMVYKQVFNRYLKRSAGITTTDYFGDIHDWYFLQLTRPPAGKNIEIMVHPLFNEGGELVDGDLRNLQAQLEPIIDHHDTISYSDL
jgi:chitin disaccharide deacetylase